MIKTSLCCLLFGLLILNQVNAQVSYAVSVPVDQSEACEHIVGLGDQLEKISVHPNPVKHTLQVSSLESGTLHVYTLTGLLVFSVTVPQGSSSVDVSQLKSGIYILRLGTTSIHRHVRLIKE